MFERLAHLVVRRRRATLVLFVLGLVAAGALGSGVFSRLQAGGFTDPGSDSAKATLQLRDQFGVADPVAALAVVTPHGLAADAGRATALVAGLQKEPGVTQVVSWRTSGHADALAGKDGRTGEVLVYTRADAKDSQKSDLAARIVADHGGDRAVDDGLTVHVSGAPAINNAITDTITADLAKADSVAIPVTMVLLVIVFGGLIAAGLPFLVAAGAVLGAFAALFAVTLATDVSVFALNLVTGLGLGLGIDYALLVVNRYREQLAAGDDVETAVVRTVTTAGRTVVVSGVTVATVLASLSLFPQYFLRSFAYAGVAVTVLAIASTVIALPAVLALLGRRVNRFKVVRGDLTPKDTGVWAGVARRAMRVPVPVLVVVGGLLLALASPAFGATFGESDDRALPAGNPAAVAAQVLREQFPGREGTPARRRLLPARGPALSAVTAYAERLSRGRGRRAGRHARRGRRRRPGRGRPEPAAVQGFMRLSDGQQRLSVVADVDPAVGPPPRTCVTAVRALPAPASGVVVGGAAAEYTDIQSGIMSRLPFVLTWIAVTTLVVLFLFTGSVLQPLQGAAAQHRSASAPPRRDGVDLPGRSPRRAARLHPDRHLDTAMPVLLFCIAFGLSMDYEVFLLTRIKEEHDAAPTTSRPSPPACSAPAGSSPPRRPCSSVVFPAFVTGRQLDQAARPRRWPSRS